MLHVEAFQSLSSLACLAWQSSRGSAYSVRWNCAKGNVSRRGWSLQRKARTSHIALDRSTHPLQTSGKSSTARCCGPSIPSRRKHSHRCLAAVDIFREPDLVPSLPPVASDVTSIDIASMSVGTWVSSVMCLKSIARTGSSIRCTNALSHPHCSSLASFLAPAQTYSARAPCGFGT